MIGICESQPNGNRARAQWLKERYITHQKYHFDHNLISKI